ncbi:hypothetical protein C8J56DRAFT_1063515 [Mycena floridula]|nr:hypothetical protein C8J56DRAFT_1063515 [Mycena floridula]
MSSTAKAPSKTPAKAPAKRDVTNPLIRKAGANVAPATTTQPKAAAENEDPTAVAKELAATKALVAQLLAEKEAQEKMNAAAEGNDEEENGHNGTNHGTNRAEDHQDVSDEDPNKPDDMDIDDKDDDDATGPTAVSVTQPAPSNNHITCVAKIAKPKGRNYSLQVEMGLSGSTKKTRQYNTILREVRDLSLNAQLPWDKAWADISARAKADFFAVVAARHPFLAKFRNNWATEKIVRQYLSNKRKTNYKKGTMDVPAKYSHLKDNAAKRDQSKSWKKTAVIILEAKKQEKCRANRQEKKKSKEASTEAMKEKEFVKGSSKDGNGDEDEMALDG